MKRRDLLQLLALYGLPSVCGCLGFTMGRYPQHFLGEKHEGGAGAHKHSGDFAEVNGATSLFREKNAPAPLNDASARSTYFLHDFADDIHFTDRQLGLMKGVTQKLRRVQQHVGHGYFNALGMDDFFRIAGYAAGIGAITSEEKAFLEEVFYFDARKYGFQGDKTAHQFTDQLQKNLIVKVPFTGHYLRKGLPLETYNKITKDLGNSVILTSGIRGIAKQFHLFFEKGLETKGNMSKASRSLAPPGYSFHGQGDFDIGKRGFGLKNFTDAFASTREYQRLLESGYVQIRYTESNHLGVRFEPWHIKIPAV